MRTESLRVAETAKDLEGLPVGTRILTALDKVLQLDRLESGATYWIEDGTLRPFPQPRDVWLPAYILPVTE